MAPLRTDFMDIRSDLRFFSSFQFFFYFQLSLVPSFFVFFSNSDLLSLP